MMQSSTFHITDPQYFKQQALIWANQFDLVCYLDNNDDANRYQSVDCILGIGGTDELVVNTGAGTAFQQLRDFFERQPRWLFGFLSYDLKNDVEPHLSSLNFDGIGLPDLHFFSPTIFIEIKHNQVSIQSNKDTNTIFKSIQKSIIPSFVKPKINTIHPRISKAQYLKTVETIQQHIIEGDIYEMNFCQEFYAENSTISPLPLFLELNELAKAPFAAYYKWNNRYLLSGSPERFLKKKGQQLISQPIKGTIKRGKTPKEDAAFRDELKHSEKDRAENVMIVDLVRNDLARTCEAGSIKVEELFGIYAFEQVFQMISTITGVLKEDTHFTKAIEYSFPMGSMTGAPKIMSMELIEQYEETKRGLYSGAVGYIAPNGDFDFNVVIRSILYNAINKYVSFQVGGAIVYDSIPEKEYEECLLKAQTMMKVLNNGEWRMENGEF